MIESAPSTPWWSWSRVRALDHRVVDPVLALAMLVLGLVSLATSPVDAQHPSQPDVLAYVLTVVGFGLLSVRTRWPLAVLGGCLTVTAWFTIIEYPENGLPVACMLALYTVAALRPRRQSAMGAVAVAGVIVYLTSLGSQGLNVPNAVGNLAVFGVAYAIGSYVRIRRAYTAELELRAQALEENRRREAEQAVAAERLRIARELHDVVAHAMSIVAVQSGVAAHVIDDDPDQARSMLTTINATSREALAEMRRLLGVLRAGDEADGSTAQLAPAPGLDDLPALVASIEGTGADVTLSVDGPQRPLAAGLDLAAFRVVQEALTNVVRHAGPASVNVRIAYGDEALGVEVVDDGRGAAHDVAVIGGGHGLMGMRERVDLYGGTLAAGPCPGGGFAVSATIPYPAAAVAP